MGFPVGTWVLSNTGTGYSFFGIVVAHKKYSLIYDVAPFARVIKVQDTYVEHVLSYTCRAENIYEAYWTFEGLVSTDKNKIGWRYRKHNTPECLGFFGKSICNENLSIKR